MLTVIVTKKVVSDVWNHNNENYLFKQKIKIKKLR